MGLTRDQLAADLERVAAGEVAAFIRVYHATSRKLFGIVVRILGRGDLADEVLQEVYLRVWQRAKEYDKARSSPITWLATIARNRALDEVRRRQPRSIEDMPELLELSSGEDIIGENAAGDELRRLQDCVGRLEPAQRDLVQLIYFEGLTREAAAARVSQSVSNVRTVLRHALAKLKGCLEP